jgi:hypothetical protein
LHQEKIFGTLITADARGARMHAGRGCTRGADARGARMHTGRGCTLIKNINRAIAVNYSFSDWLFFSGSISENPRLSASNFSEGF